MIECLIFEIIKMFSLSNASRRNINRSIVEEI